MHQIYCILIDMIEWTIDFELQELLKVQILIQYKNSTEKLQTLINIFKI